ncbi:hypothetical protein MKX01_035981 [Papaver californicum]|nr:hypothetical protein MKX01_035981 [Papaver californicum]
MEKQTSIHYSFLIIIFQSTYPSSAAQQPIKTIVVLVLENRSFDHMMGWMKKTINPNINGFVSPMMLNMSTRILVTRDQVFGFNSSTPTMNGFVEQALTMPEAVPVFASLVSEFAIIDRWFSALPGPTEPNRLFVYSGTSHGATNHVKKQLLMGFPQKTIFDSLHEDVMEFGIYFQTVPTTLFYRNFRKLKYISKFHQFDSSFKKDASEGKLPSLTVIEPRYFDLVRAPANDDHPSHDVANGQKFVKEIYEALRSSPQWNETLFIITYDEHGGFYDHVTTPYENVPNPDGNTGPAPLFFKFDRLGVRVPTIMHSSIPATIKKMFNLSSNFLTHRDAWAGIFEEVVGELTAPRTDCPEVLPDVTPLTTTEANEDGDISEFQNEVVQLDAVLDGDHMLSSFRENTRKKMSVKEADEYVNGAISRFFRARKEAVKLGAHESAIVDMRSSLTTRSKSHP